MYSTLYYSHSDKTLKIIIVSRRYTPSINVNIRINSIAWFVILNVCEIPSRPAVIAPEAVVLSHVNLGGS